ncbi:uncharacterized protein LOC27208734 [Drosophila simulans]|uniref:uncharacterized protein LOC27208734 n=1 Tax=Drosophila simulans TaxID=7240 RepID=UPI00192CF616|nr:uncharacterized protein LOC27208734 [Drosophila simulans]
MLLSLSQFESFENRRSEVASSSIPLTEIGGSRVLSVSQRWVLGSGFTVLMGKWMFVRLFLSSTCQHLPNTRKSTGRDVRKLEMEEPSCSTQKPQGNPNSHTHTEPFLSQRKSRNEGIRLRFRGRRKEKGSAL